MSRSGKISEMAALDAALWQFWRCGYHQSSMDQLVCVTGSTRHSLYALFGSKHGLFLRCLDHYRVQVVDPAFAVVEKHGATLKDIADYFETQIGRAASLGMPGPGCLIANSMTELAPHDAAVMQRVHQHHQRLSEGFARVIRHQAGAVLSRSEARAMGEMLASNAQGLWSWSRSVSSPTPLRRYVRTLLSTIERSLRP